MKKIKTLMKKPLLIGIIVFIVLLTSMLTAYFIALQPVSRTSTLVEITVERGMTGNDLASTLREKGLIRSETIFRWHLRATGQPFLAGNYQLDKNMDLLTIIGHLTNGTSLNNERLVIPEGSNVRGIARIIEIYTNNTADDVFELLKDESYIDSLIEEHWFLTNEIKNPNLFFPLEGYLFPNTYEISSKDVTVKEIFSKMLAQTDQHLTELRSDIEKHDFTIHEFLTLASIVQSEGRVIEDFKKIASVFHTRLEQGIGLESCVTTYYGIGMDLGERELKRTEINATNPFNTRARGFLGLPVGPVSNPGKDAMEATANPDETPYLFFVSDSELNTHFTRTYAEHQALIRELRRAGRWHQF